MQLTTVLHYRNNSYLKLFFSTQDKIFPIFSENYMKQIAQTNVCQIIELDTRKLQTYFPRLRWYDVQGLSSGLNQSSDSRVSI